MVLEISCTGNQLRCEILYLGRGKKEIHLMAVVLELNYYIPSVGTMCTGFFSFIFSGDHTSVTSIGSSSSAQVSTSSTDLSLIFYGFTAKLNPVTKMINYAARQ